MAEYDWVMRAFTVLVPFATAISTSALADARQDRVRDLPAPINEQVPLLRLDAQKDGCSKTRSARCGQRTSHGVSSER